MRVFFSGLLNLLAGFTVIVMILLMFDTRTTIVLILIYGLIAVGVASSALIGGERLRKWQENWRGGWRG